MAEPQPPSSPTSSPAGVWGLSTVIRVGASTLPTPFILVFALQNMFPQRSLYMFLLVFLEVRVLGRRGAVVLYLKCSTS